MAHAPPALQVPPRYWFVICWITKCLHGLQYTSMSVMNDTHVWSVLHDGNFHLAEEPNPAEKVLTLHKCHGKWDDLIVPVHTNSSKDLPSILTGQECTIHKHNRRTMPESFDAHSEREEYSFQHLEIRYTLQPRVLYVYISAGIPLLQYVQEMDNNII